jgi:hypothetical protein
MQAWQLASQSQPLRLGVYPAEQEEQLLPSQERQLEGQGKQRRPLAEGK